MAKRKKKQGRRGLFWKRRTPDDEVVLREAAFGPDAGAFHIANIVAHAACVLLVYVAAGVVLTRAVPKASATLRNAAAVSAALLFGLHPLRVEVVAWISAMPYALALALLLASLLVRVVHFQGWPLRETLGRHLAFFQQLRALSTKEQTRQWLYGTVDHICAYVNGTKSKSRHALVEKMSA